MPSFVYILTNKSNTLYVGSTDDLLVRVKKHKASKAPHFTAKYKINRLIYWKAYQTRKEARLWENKIKGWTRNKKMELIKSLNPNFRDLLEESETSAEILRPLDSG